MLEAYSFMEMQAWGLKPHTQCNLKILLQWNLDKTKLKEMGKNTFSRGISKIEIHLIEA